MPMMYRYRFLQQKIAGFGMELKPGLLQKFPYLPGAYWKPNQFLPAV